MRVTLELSYLNSHTCDCILLLVDLVNLDIVGSYIWDIINYQLMCSLVGNLLICVKTKERILTKRNQWGTRESTSKMFWACCHMEAELLLWLKSCFNSTSWASKHFQEESCFDTNKLGRCSKKIADLCEGKYKTKYELV